MPPSESTGSGDATGETVSYTVSVKSKGGMALAGVDVYLKAGQAVGAIRHRVWLRARTMANSRVRFFVRYIPTMQGFPVKKLKKFNRK